ncbi:hypothetical protein Tco_1301351 [Tanacetum coccineum]
MEELTAKLDEHLATLNIDLDIELFPHMLTAITGRRWVIGYGFRLAVMKFKESYESGIEHGKAGKILENVKSYDAEVEAKYLAAASFTLERNHGEEDQRRMQPITKQLIVLVYYERGGSRVPGSLDREILLHDALAASRVKGEKNKKGASLNLVVVEPFAVVSGSQPSSLALSVQAFMVNASMMATSLIPAPGPSQVGSEAAGDRFALTVVVSQEAPIVVTDYQISDVNVARVRFKRMMICLNPPC